MFDTIYVGRGRDSHHTHTSTVHEHRAPTDQSVKLLNEMTEKARANLIGAFSTTNNALQATWAMQEDHRTAKREFWCKCVINGRESKFTIALEQDDSKEQCLHKLYEKLCALLAAEIMTPLLREMKSKF